MATVRTDARTFGEQRAPRSGACPLRDACVAITVVLAAAAGPEAGAAQIAPPSAEGGRLTIAPYLWMAGISGDTGVRDLTADVDISFGELLPHLRFAAMLAVEGGYGRWMGAADLMYTSVREDRARSIGPVHLDLTATMKMLISNLFVGYSFTPSPAVAVDLFAGARVWAVDAALNVSGERREAERTSDPSWADAVGGARVRWQIAERWQLGALGDGGAGGSESTAGALVTALYGVSSRWRLFAAYRYLALERRKGDFFFDGNLSGPVLGGVYRW